MEITSAQAAKLLRKYREEFSALRAAEDQTREFLASVGEDPESVRPAYDYAATQAALREKERAIRRIKHALNLFNTTHQVPGFDMTVDELLVYMPQLTARKEKLARMKSALPKVRETVSFGKGIIDYRYANYDVAAAAAEYEAVSEELSAAQTALDLLNNTVTFPLDL